MNRNVPFQFVDGAKVAGFELHNLSGPRLAILFDRGNPLFTRDVESISEIQKQRGLAELIFVLSQSARDLAIANRRDDTEWELEIDTFLIEHFDDEETFQEIADTLNKEMRAWAARGMSPTRLGKNEGARSPHSWISSVLKLLGRGSRSRRQKQSPPPQFTEPSPGQRG